MVENRMTAAGQGPDRPRVGLMVTCLVDLMRPSVGFAAVKLLEEAGCEVVVPSQTCCGQPAWNSGDRATTADLARAMIDAFDGCDWVVAPSGSCAGMVAHHYEEVFDAGSKDQARAKALAARTMELTSFLHDIRGVRAVTARLPGTTVTYHDSCSGLREMGVKAQPRALLATVEGLSLTEMKEPETCCGFGGTFCVKYPEVSGKIVADKAADIQATGAGMLLAGDLGCLMNMAGYLKRQGSKVEVRHVAEVLAGDLSSPAIAEVRDAGRPS